MILENQQQQRYERMAPIIVKHHYLAQIELHDCVPKGFCHNPLSLFFLVVLDKLDAELSRNTSTISIIG